MHVGTDLVLWRLVGEPLALSCPGPQLHWKKEQHHLRKHQNSCTHGSTQSSLRHWEGSYHQRIRDPHRPVIPNTFLQHQRGIILDHCTSLYCGVASQSICINEVYHTLYKTLCLENLFCVFSVFIHSKSRSFYYEQVLF